MPFVRIVDNETEMSDILYSKHCAKSNKMDIASLIRKMPKIVNKIVFICSFFSVCNFSLTKFIGFQELHAHLNGSLSDRTMQRLHEMKFGSCYQTSAEYKLNESVSLNS